MKLQTEFENIHTTGFKSLKVESASKKALVLFNVSDVISLSLFAVHQLLAGGELLRERLLTAGMQYITDKHSYDVLSVMAKLFKASLNLQFMPNDTPDSMVAKTIEIPVLRGDIEILIDLLRLRMLHCEKQRDARNPEFNADTYITQKLLLIELKEWLMGLEFTIVEEEPKVDELKVQEELTERTNQHGAKHI